MILIFSYNSLNPTLDEVKKKFHFFRQVWKSSSKEWNGLCLRVQRPDCFEVTPPWCIPLPETRSSHPPSAQWAIITQPAGAVSHQRSSLISPATYLCPTEFLFLFVNLLLFIHVFFFGTVGRNHQAHLLKRPWGLGVPLLHPHLHQHLAHSLAPNRKQGISKMEIGRWT